MKLCKKRKTVINFEQDGSKTEVYQCSETTSVKHGLEVVEEECEACPVREAVNKRFIDREARRTSNLPGVVRQEKCQGNEWFPDCGSRIIATVRTCCGQTGSVWICDHRASSRYQSEVNPKICELCPLKVAKHLTN